MSKRKALIDTESNLFETTGELPIVELPTFHLQSLVLALEV